MKANLTATYAPLVSGDDSGEGVILQADIIESVRRYAKLNDINQMLARSHSGLSADTYTSPECPARFYADGSVFADIGLTAWPCPLDIAYTLAASQGELSAPERVAVEKSFDVVTAFSMRATLPAIMDPLTWAWQTPCYNEFGEQVAPPEITVDARDLIFSAPVFGVLRVSGLAHGDHYILALKIALAQAVGLIPAIDPSGFDLDAKVSSTITAAWMNSNGLPGHAIEELAAPECVNDMTDTCEDGTPVGGSVSIDDADEKTPVVYYSTCTGRPIEVRYE